MARVGIRELRQSASDLLRRVRQGETIEITDRGHPVAVLGPIPQGTSLERLKAAGRVDAASADLEQLPPPIDIPEGAELPSSVLARLRHEER